MLSTPEGPPGSTSTASPGPPPGRARDTVPDPPDDVSVLQRAALLRAQQDFVAPPAGGDPGPWSGSHPDGAGIPHGDAGALAPWLAHHQLGAAAETIGADVARLLGVVPRAEREAMTAAVTEALVRAARDQLDRTAERILDGTARSALERACMAALDRQAQISIDEARRRNSLEADEESAPGLPAHNAFTTTGSEPAATAQAPPGLRVLVTDDAGLAGGDWHAQRLRAQVSAHRVALTALSGQARAAAQDLETTLDCWVRGTPPSAGAGGSPTLADLTAEDSWRAQAGMADHAAATADGARVLADGDRPERTRHPEDGHPGSGPAGLGLQLLSLTRSDLTVASRQVSAGADELLVRGAAALAANLGERGTVVADGITTLDPSTSPLLESLTTLLTARAELASDAAALTGLVAFAGSLTGSDVSDGEPGQPPTSATARSTLEPGLRELARQALLHERLVAHLVDTLHALDEDLAAWTRTPESGGPPPLLTALGRERLHEGTDPFTHILILLDEGLAADVMSRRSILGTSGRLTHVGTATVSWLLVSAAGGEVVGGGQAAPARSLTQDLTSGRSTGRDLRPDSTTGLPLDSQQGLELAVKSFAVTSGLALLIFAVVALLGIVLE